MALGGDSLILDHWCGLHASQCSHTGNWITRAMELGCISTRSWETVITGSWKSHEFEHLPHSSSIFHHGRPCWCGFFEFSHPALRMVRNIFYSLQTNKVFCYSIAQQTKIIVKTISYPLVYIQCSFLILFAFLVYFLMLKSCFVCLFMSFA